MKVFTMFRSRGDISSWSLFLLVRLYSSVSSFVQLRSVRFFLAGCNVLRQNILCNVKYSARRGVLVVMKAENGEIGINYLS